MSWLKLLNLAEASKAGASGRVAKMLIDGPIGGFDWFDGSGTVASQFIRMADALGLEAGDEFDIDMNSPGGVISDGVAIANFLINHPASVRINVIGQAASIASVIAQAADPGKLHMGIGTTMFVHKPSALLGGSYDAGKLTNIAGTLDKQESAIADMYVQRAKARGKELSLDDVNQLMADATTMTAEEAVTWGLADTMDAELKAVACADLSSALEQATEQAVARGQQAVETQNLELERNELRNTVTDLQQQIVVLQSGPTPADPAAVITACTEAGITSLAAGWVEAKLPMAEITARVQRATAINDLCAASGEDPAPYMAQLDEPVEALRIAMAAIQVAKDQNIDNTLQPGDEGRGKTGKGHTDIYRARNKFKVLMR